MPSGAAAAAEALQAHAGMPMYTHTHHTSFAHASVIEPAVSKAEVRQPRLATAASRSTSTAAASVSMLAVAALAQLTFARHK